VIWVYDYDEVDIPSGALNVGDIMCGTYTYDSSNPDVDPGYPWDDFKTYRYAHPPSGIMLQIGDFTFQSDPEDVQVTMTIIDNRDTHIGDTFDRIDFVSTGNLPLLDGASVVNISLLFVAFSFEGNNPLSSSALPLNAPTLNEWGEATFDIDAQGFSVDGYLTSAVLIPEPATIIPLAVGGLALIRKLEA